MNSVVSSIAKTLLLAAAFTSAAAWGVQAKHKEKATPLVAHVTLQDFKLVKPSEKGGDELYFSVTEYSSIERSRNYLVPAFPTHWLSSQLKELKNVVLWEKPLQDKESVMLVISLLERDAPPWNVDDLLGTLKVKLQNNAGKLKKEVTIPNKEDTKQDDATHYAFTGETSEYHLKFSVGN